MISGYDLLSKVKGNDPIEDLEYAWLRYNLGYKKISKKVVIKELEVKQKIAVTFKDKSDDFIQLQFLKTLEIDPEYNDMLDDQESVYICMKLTEISIKQCEREYEANLPMLQDTNKKRMKLMFDKMSPEELNDLLKITKKPVDNKEITKFEDVQYS